MEKTYEEIAEYISTHEIKGRHEMRHIRDYMLENFPERRDGVNFSVSSTKLPSEITYKDFLNFIQG